MGDKAVPQPSFGGGFSAKSQDFPNQDDGTPHFGKSLEKVSEESSSAKIKDTEERGTSSVTRNEASHPPTEFGEDRGFFEHGVKTSVDDTLSAQSTKTYGGFPSFGSLESSNSLAPGAESFFSSNVFGPPVLINRSASTSDQSSSRRIQQDPVVSTDPVQSGDSETGSTLPYLLLTEALSIYPSKCNPEGETTGEGSSCVQQVVSSRPFASEADELAGSFSELGIQRNVVPQQGVIGPPKPHAASESKPSEENTESLSHRVSGTFDVAEELRKVISEQARREYNHCIDVDAEKMFEALSVAWASNSTPVNEANIGSESPGLIHGGTAGKPGSEMTTNIHQFRNVDKQVFNDPAVFPSSTSSHPSRNPIETLSAGTASPEFIGRRHTFPGCPSISTEDEGAFVSENNGGRSSHRRRTGPFPLPASPLDAELEKLFRWGEGQDTDSLASSDTGSFFDFSGAGPTTSGSGSRPLSELISRGSCQAGGGSGGQAKFTLIVNVPPTTTRQDLYVTFSAFGKVELTVVVCDKDHRHPNREWTATSGYAFVRFSKSSEAAAAVAAAASGTVRLRGSRVRATWAKKDSLPKHSSEAPPTGCGSSNQGEIASPRSSRPLNRRSQIGGGDAGGTVKIPLSVCLEPKSAQEFACCLCRQYLAADPVVLPCWHMFCAYCLGNFSSFQESYRGGCMCDCPECGLPVASSAVKKMDEATTGPLFKLRQVRDAEAVACPFNPYCQWTGQAGSFAAHMQSHCPPPGKSFSNIAELFSTDLPSSPTFGQ